MTRWTVERLEYAYSEDEIELVYDDCETHFADTLTYDEAKDLLNALLGAMITLAKELEGE